MRSNPIFASHFLLPVLTSLSTNQKPHFKITTPTQSGFSLLRVPVQSGLRLLRMPVQRRSVYIVIGQSLSKVR